ncbi:MAG: glycosyl hydrolase [Bacteroidia bacterium]|nr:glycosyl hydrolase [Bacteroidia bacterium]
MKRTILFLSIFVSISFSIASQTLVWTPGNGDGISFFSSANWIDSSTGVAPVTGIVGTTITLNRNIEIMNAPYTLGGGSGIGATILVGNGNMTLKKSGLLLTATKLAGIVFNSGKSLQLDSAKLSTEFVDGAAIAMSNGSSIDFFGADPLRNGASINLMSNKEYVSFQKVDAAKVISQYLALITYNGEAAVNGTNVKVVSAGFGSIVVSVDYVIESPLKLYSGYNFTGEKADLVNGMYDGSLGVFDNKAVSFVLEKGYMVTFAQDRLGAGVSKVYIAADNKLQINLPAALQKTISFVRVSPWFNNSKKGMGGKSADVVGSFNSSWFYDWGAQDVSTNTMEYVVMNWGGGVNQSNVSSWGVKMNLNHHLAFNEPDGADQANMTVDAAISQYELLMASGLRLGAPACTDGAKGETWRDEFMTKAIAKGLRIDFIPVHYYKRNSAASFYNWLKDIYNKYKLPLWITEFNYGSTWIAEIPQTEVEAGLRAYVNMLDTARIIERYAVFTWQPPSTMSLMSVRNPVTLNSTGVFYRDKVSAKAYRQEVYTQGPELPNALNSLHASNERISAWPNPVKDGILNLTIGAEKQITPFSATIFDLMGRKLLENSKLQESSNSMDVSSLAKGIYNARIVTKGKTGNVRFVVE